MTFFDPSLDGACLDGFLSSVSSPLYPSTGSSAMSDTSGPSDSPQSDLAPEHASPSRNSSSSPVRTSGTTRKRVRPKVDLAPGQPPTARGNPRIRVFVACYQCRARKIRCDGAKPVCCNCQKRSSAADQCNYDSGPNRRGREKGSTRARAALGPSGQKTPRPKLTPQSDADHSSTAPSLIPDPSEGFSSSNEPSPVLVDQPDVDGLFDFSDEMAWEIDPSLYDATSFMDAALLPEPDLSVLDFGLVPEPAIVVTPPEDRAEDEAESIPAKPSTRFARDTWWDALLSFYVADHGFRGGDMQLVTIGHEQRKTAMKSIVSDLRALFQASPCWLDYLHLPRFFDTLFSTVRRNSMQPSLILASLALGTLAQSSEAEHGAKGMTKALKLLDMANGALEASLATGWVDIGLAQAALMILCFEMQSHPKQTFERSNSALQLVDSLFRLFGLTKIDENLKPRGLSPYGVVQPQGYNPAVHMGFIPAPPNASYSTPGTGAASFQGPNYVPPSNASLSLADGTPMGFFPRQGNHPPPSHGAGCNCLAFSLGERWPSVHSIAPSWRGTMMWPEGLSEAEFRREECRRLVWSSIMVIANMNAYTSAAPDSVQHICSFTKLFAREPENFSLLFPTEALANTGVSVEADDIWTLNYRTMLLLHVCMRTREDPRLSLADRAQLSVQAWMEIDDIEQRLRRHTCDLDSLFGFQAKELLFGLRMLTSYEFQRYIPQVTTAGSTLFYRDKAEAWLRYSDETCQLVWKSFSGGANSPAQNHRKSLLLYWYISNVRKAIALWKADHGLTYALDFAKRCAEHTEYVMMYWPNTRMRRVWQDIRYSLVDSCLKAGVSPPAPALPRAIPKMDPPPDSDANITDLIVL